MVLSSEKLESGKALAVDAPLIDQSTRHFSTQGINEPISSPRPQHIKIMRISGILSSACVEERGLLVVVIGGERRERLTMVFLVSEVFQWLSKRKIGEEGVVAGGEVEMTKKKKKGDWWFRLVSRKRGVTVVVWFVLGCSPAFMEVDNEREKREEVVQEGKMKNGKFPLGFSERGDK
ncbi:hypothetical protein HAX54_006321 [Datura stramonium]|uniref:Uncharacterized protein n=1 Tax=Datura stramonium TaxID=4076 RepID=A0ABS8TAW7_DATST|nr:hypothetical protein [Datura stramonium]